MENGHIVRAYYITIFLLVIVNKIVMKWSIWYAPKTKKKKVVNLNNYQNSGINNTKLITWPFCNWPKSFHFLFKKKNWNILSYNCYIGKITKNYINQIFILMTNRDGPTILSYQGTRVKKKKLQIGVFGEAKTWPLAVGLITILYQQCIRGQENIRKPRNSQ